MLNFNLAMTLIVVIWVIVIAALVIWYLIARARRKRRAEQVGGPLRHGAASRGAVADDAGAGGPLRGGAVPLGPDTTQPVQRLPGRPTTPPQHSAGPEPFGLTTQREYERLAAEPFQAPPATALGEERSSERFSWAEASSSGPTRPATRRADPTSDSPERPAARPVPIVTEPAPVKKAEPESAQPAKRSRPAPAVRKATGITDEPVAPSTTEPVAPSTDDLDRTVIVSRGVTDRAAFDWSLALPDGELLPLGPDCVVGRRPVPVDGAASVVIADPTRTLSKSHARLRFDGDRWWVTDLGSTNGIWLLHSSGVEEELRAHEEAEATPRLRLGTLDVELRRQGSAV